MIDFIKSYNEAHFIVRVENYTGYVPMKITGWGFGDADPPQDIEIDYEILDLDGQPAPWVEDEVPSWELDRIIGEIIDALEN